MPNRGEKIGPRSGSTKSDVDRDRDGTGLLLELKDELVAVSGHRDRLLAGLGLP